MSVAQMVIEESDSYLDNEFVDEMVKQLRALDTYDTYEGWSKAQILDPLVLTKERKKEIPIVGDPDEITISRVKAYYNALSSMIEKESGMMAVSLVNLSHEGFGRALIMVGKLIVVDSVLRDIHRFGFASLEKMCAQSDKMINRASQLLEKYKDAAMD